MKLFIKKLTTVLAIMAIMTTMCVPAYAAEDISMTMGKVSTFTVSLPGSFTFDSTTFTPTSSIINMQWSESEDLNQTLNLVSGTAVQMMLTGCYSGYNSLVDATAANLTASNVISENGIITLIDQKTVTNTSPNKLYCKLGLVDETRYPSMGCRPLDAGIGLNTDFSYVQLVSGSSTEYEDVIGGMTISKLYVDAACTIPATTQNTRAGVYSAGLIFSISKTGM